MEGTTTPGMSQIQAILLGAVIGAVSSLVGSIILEFVRQWLQDRKTERLTRLMLQLGLPPIMSSIDHLASDYEKLKRIPREHLVAIYASRQRYDRRGDAIILFRDRALGNDIAD